MHTEWLHWYYLIYLLPAAVAVLVLLMTGMGGHHGGHSHAAHGGLHLHTHHAAHAGGAAHGHAAAHGAHGHAHHHASGSHPSHSAAGHGERDGPSAAQQLLGFFGVGRAPITIVIGSLLIGWGLFGLGATELLRPLLRVPALFVGPSLAVAAVGSLLSAKLIGEFAARVMPQDETYVISREGLVGLTGKVVYPVSDTAGRVHVFDRFRTLHVTSARVEPGAAPLAKGADVIITSLDTGRGYALVEPLGFSRERGPASKSRSADKNPVTGSASGEPASASLGMADRDPSPENKGKAGSSNE
jgi:membrane protein implicated in regulation of membrane protease activity